MKKRKRLFKNAIVYALVAMMVVTTIPLQAFASDDNYEVTETEITESAPAEEVIPEVTQEVIEEVIPEETNDNGDDAIVNENENGNTEDGNIEVPIETPAEIVETPTEGNNDSVNPEAKDEEEILADGEEETGEELPIEEEDLGLVTAKPRMMMKAGPGPKPKHKITYEIDNGTVTYCPEECEEGQDFAITYEANIGYAFEKLEIIPKKGEPDVRTGNLYDRGCTTITMGKEDIHLKVTFVKSDKYFDITYNVPNGNGKIIGPTRVLKNQLFDVSYESDPGYELDYLVVNPNVDDPNSEPITYNSKTNVPPPNFKAGANMSLTAYFRVKPNYINNFTINSITEPVKVATYVNDVIYSLSDNVEVVDATWMDGRTKLYLNDMFKPNKTYTLTLNVKPKEGYEFKLIGECTANLANVTVTNYTINNAKSATVTLSITVGNIPQPNVNITKGEHFPVELPNTLKAGDKVDLSFKMSNTGNATLNFNKYYETRGFIISGGNGDTIISSNTGNTIAPNQNLTLTYKLNITQADIDAGKVVRSFYCNGLIQDPNTGGTNNATYKTNTVEINLPIKEGGDIGYIESINVTLPELVVGKPLPKKDAISVNNTNCNVKEIKWTPNDPQVKNNTMYTAVITVDLKPEYKGIFNTASKGTINNEAPYNFSRKSDRTVELTYRTITGLEAHGFDVTITPEGAGSVSFSKDKVKMNETVDVKITENSGYKFNYISFNGNKFYEPEFTYKMTFNSDVPVTVYFDSYYKVSFDANGGQGTMNPIENIIKNTEIDVPECEFTREGYEFAYWVIRRGNGIKVEGPKIMVDDNLTLKAIWEEVTPPVPTKCTIAFSTNFQYSNGAMLNVRVDNGATYTVPEPTGFTAYDGYEFDYWLLREQGKEDKKVYPNDEIIVTNDIYLDANWKAVTPVNPEYNININCGEHGSIFFKKDGKIVTKAHAGDLIAWSVTEDDGYMKVNGTPTCDPNVDGFSSGIFKMPAHDITVNISFVKRIEHTISFDANGGTGTMNSLKVLDKVNYPLPTCKFEKEGYEFDYWTINGVKVTGLYCVTSDVVYVANWKAVTPVNPEYNLTSDCTNGTIIFEKDGKPVTKAHAGDEIDITIKALEGYAYVQKTLEFKDTIPTNYVIRDNDLYAYFTMPEGNVTVTATFVKPVDKVEITADEPTIGGIIADINFSQTGGNGIDGAVGLFTSSGLSACEDKVFKSGVTYGYEVMVETDTAFSEDATITFNSQDVTILKNLNELENAVSAIDGKSKVVYGVVAIDEIIVIAAFPTLKDPEPEKFTVNYDIDGESASYTVEAGKKHTVVDFKEVYKKALLENEEFGVWKDNTGKTYKVGEEITVDSDINLSATIVIKPKYEFRVSADPSNTECISKGYVSANSFIEVPDYTAKLDISKVFYNWVCDGENYYPEETVCVEEDMIFYPEIGENRKFEIIVDPENGKPAKIYNLYDGEIFIAPEYEWTAPKGKKFDHWVLLPAQPVFRLAIIPGYGAVDVKPGEEIKVTKAFTLSASFVDLPDDPKPDDPKPNDPKPNDPKPNDPKPNDPKPEDPKPNTAPASKNEAVVTPAKEVKQPNADDLPQTGGPQTSLAIPLTIGSTLVLAGFSIFFASKKRKNKS